MKLFLISDNVDTLVGMRLAGVKGVVAHEREEVLDALKAAADDRETGIIVITEKLSQLVGEELNAMKLKTSLPLIVEIPDRHGSRKGVDRITRYIREAIGLEI
ncbi:MAG TPA: V-type ATP synthase subunit F [Candidatus Atribacteria bacterium]|nr:V-type ATP synthase subunit F [Candidatus Atribacteria bacterium]HPT79189.1 V-type ATP synthase subunit F [Candidatus Atribacteria bacterium]